MSTSTTDEQDSLTTHNNVTIQSTGKTDSGQPDITMTVLESSPLGSNTGYVVGGAVGGLMVVIVVAVVVIVIVLLVVKRGQAHKIPEGEEMLASSLAQAMTLKDIVYRELQDNYPTHMSKE